MNVRSTGQTENFDSASIQKELSQIEEVCVTHNVVVFYVS